MAWSNGLLRRGLRNTDERVAADKPVTPTFLFALLLYGPIAQVIESLPPQRWHELGAIVEACDRTLRAAATRVTIPRRVALGVRRNVRLQPRLEQPRGKRALAVARAAALSLGIRPADAARRAWAWRRRRLPLGGHSCRRPNPNSACGLVDTLASSRSARLQQNPAASGERGAECAAERCRRCRCAARSPPAAPSALSRPGLNALASGLSSASGQQSRRSRDAGAPRSRGTGRAARARGSLRQSSLYGSKPMGPVAQPDFVNAVAGAAHAARRDRVLRELRQLERALGRAPAARALGPAPHRSGSAAVRATAAASSESCSCRIPG